MSITIIRATKERAKLMSPEIALEMGKIYLGTFTFFIRPAAPSTEPMERLVVSLNILKRICPLRR